MRTKIRSSKITGQYLQETHQLIVQYGAVEFVLDVPIDVSVLPSGFYTGLVNLRSYKFYDVVDFEIRKAVLMQEELNLDCIEEVWNKLFKRSWKDVNKELHQVADHYAKHLVDSIDSLSKDFRWSILAEYTMAAGEYENTYSDNSIEYIEEDYRDNDDLLIPYLPWYIRTVAKGLGVKVEYFRDDNLNWKTRVQYTPEQYKKLNDNCKKLKNESI